MTKSSRAPLLVRRRVIEGDVIVVRNEMPPEEPAAHLASGDRGGRPAPDADSTAGASPEPQPYTPAPPGYAYEFGTWRLVPVD